MNLPWVEKYRPNTLGSIVLSNENKKCIEYYIDHVSSHTIHNIKNNNIHLIFYGPPGTGKTTTAINVYKEVIKKQIENTLSDDTHSQIFKHCSIENILKQQTLHLNASDDRGIDVLRNIIYEFIMNSNRMDAFVSKFVVFDEIDYMTIKSQNVLKNILQQNKNVNFIFICNYIGKLHTFITNNCIDLKFNNLDSSHIYEKIRYICEKEDLDSAHINIEDILGKFNSDLRSMINYLQQYKNYYYKKNISNTYCDFIHILKKNSQIEYNELKTYIHTLLQSMNVRDVLKHITENTMQYIKDLHMHDETIETIYPGFSLLEFLHLHKELLFNKNIDGMTEYYLYKLSGFFSSS